MRNILIVLTALIFSCSAPTFSQTTTFTMEMYWNRTDSSLRVVLTQPRDHWYVEYVESGHPIFSQSALDPATRNAHATLMPYDTIRSVTITGDLTPNALITAANAAFAAAYGSACPDLMTCLPDSFEAVPFGPDSRNHPTAGVLCFRNGYCREECVKMLFCKTGAEAQSIIPDEYAEAMSSTSMSHLWLSQTDVFDVVTTEKSYRLLLKPQQMASIGSFASQEQ